MMICRVTGSVVSTHKNEHLDGEKILIVQPLDLDLSEMGSDMLALDKVDAGSGDLVLVMREGGSAQILYDNKKLPIQAVIVGFIDDIHIQDKK